MAETNVISSIKLPNNISYILQDDNAARTNHTHTISMAADANATSSITLGYNSKYKITAAGSNYTFTTPALPSAADIGLGQVVTSISYNATNHKLTYKINNNSTNTEITTAEITIAGQTIGLGGSINASTLRESLGLSSIMHFRGIATVTIVDESTTNPVIDGYDFSKKEAGDVIIDSTSAYEFIWTGTKWERLGPDGSYKIIQESVSTPAASGTAIAFIDTISQNSNGVISITKKTIPSASETVAGITTVGTTSGAAPYTGSTAVTILGTVTTGTWHGTAIEANYMATMTGASSSAAGAAGIVPAPQAGNQVAFLQGDATWYKLNVRNGSHTNAGIKACNTTNNVASGAYAFAAGNATTASGDYSFAVGASNVASGLDSQAVGGATTASGTCAHSEGHYTIANHYCQHVFGCYNIADTSTAAATAKGNYVEIVGNGTSGSARSNARTLDWSGNEILGGTCQSTQFYEVVGNNAPSREIILNSAATLLPANWNNLTQTVTVQGVTSSNTVIVAAAPASVDEYALAKIKCTAQGVNSLTFTCQSVPTSSLLVNVVII